MQYIVTYREVYEVVTVVEAENEDQAVSFVQDGNSEAFVQGPDTELVGLDESFDYTVEEV